MSTVKRFWPKADTCVCMRVLNDPLFVCFPFQVSVCQRLGVSAWRHLCICVCGCVGVCVCPRLAFVSVAALCSQTLNVFMS